MRCFLWCCRFSIKQNMIFTYRLGRWFQWFIYKTKKNALKSCYQQQSNAFRSCDIITTLSKFIIPQLLFFVNWRFIQIQNWIDFCSRKGVVIWTTYFMTVSIQNWLKPLFWGISWNTYLGISKGNCYPISCCSFFKEKSNH